MSQCTLFVAVGFGWLNQSTLRYYSKDHILNSYNNNRTKAIFISIVSCLLILSIFIYFQPLSIKIYCFSIMLIIMMGCFNYVKTLFQSKILPKKVFILTSIQASLSLAIPLFLMKIISSNKEFLLLGVSFSFLLSMMFLIKTSFKNYRFRNIKNLIAKQNNDLLKKWAYYGTPLSLWFAVGLALPFLDRFFINIYLPDQYLGLYASTQELLTRFFSLTLFPFIMALHPRIMSLWNKSNYHDATRLINQSISLVFIIGVIILYIVWKFNDFTFLLMGIMIPGFDSESRRLIVPLLASGLLWQLSFLTHKMLELMEKTSLMTMAIIPSLIINIIGNYYFLPIIGGRATAYSSLLSAFIYCSITGIYSIYSMNKIKSL